MIGNDEKPQRDVIRPYVVDGIQEYDNPLPPWWVWMFTLSIAFGAAYLIYTHAFGWDSIDQELAHDQQSYAEFIQTLAESAPSPDNLLARLSDPQNAAEGKALYATNCAACHGSSGEGVVGPNLTDKFWIHGGSPTDIVKIISIGVPEKGMLAWGPILGGLKVEKITAYILTLQGTSPAAAKEPQGEAYEP